MLAKRIIPCLDVKNNKVIKGIQFKNHKIVGDIVTLAERYASEGADELVFYDIEASLNNKTANKYWIKKIAQVIDIPFCVAGGIKTIQQAQEILEFGADKISINTPALIQPELITKLAKHFGTQCIVVGIDSWYNQKEKTYQVKCYTGNYACMKTTIWSTKDWVKKVQELGAGEIVLNMMNQDGTKQGYDINQLRQIKKNCKVPLIASGGAGTYEHFLKIFHDNYADGALAASVFHKNAINIFELKKFLIQKGIKIRLC